MTTCSIFAPDANALACLLKTGGGPVLVPDPCGALWETFNEAEHGWPLWQAWRLAPGQTVGDSWDVLAAVRQVNPAAGAAALAGALFPAGAHGALTRRLMTSLLMFAAETGHPADLPALAGQLWGADPWTVIARWCRQYPAHPALQAARALLTLSGAGDAMAAIRARMGLYYHPYVSAAFAAGGGFNLSTLAYCPAQIIFLTPDMRCMEDRDLTGVFAFLLTALCEFGALHGRPFTVLNPMVNPREEAL